MANMELQNKREVILHKQQLLDAASQQLKQEFIGLNDVIDEIISAISTWFCFPDMQERPVVVNLWGLTGVGKSALVHRLAQLLSFEKGYYHFDLGKQYAGTDCMQRQLEEIYEGANGLPILIALDEFQHARTIDESGKETRNADIGILWELLDSGKFQIYSSSSSDLLDTIPVLEHALKAGVRVSKGKVVSKINLFTSTTKAFIEDPCTAYTRTPIKYIKNAFLEKNADKKYFVPPKFYEDIYEIGQNKFANPSEVGEKLCTMNGAETITFLKNLCMYGYVPQTVDCSKAFIFVIGNLDEAYTMHRNFSADISADEFHEQSTKITVPIIKKALKKRFRAEQLARLGNTHIIYSAFSQESFKRIIQSELFKSAKKFQAEMNIKLSFDRSIEALIYREGVYPTQGTRPVFSTIHQVVNSKFGSIATALIVNKLPASEIWLKFEGNKVVAEYLHEQEILHVLPMRQVLKLEKLRKNKKDDAQALAAVHEAGHAILASLLLDTIPEVVLSNTVESDVLGFVHTKCKREYTARHEIKKRLAVFLGGYVAEKQVFGKDNITTGAQDDIQRATQLVTRMLKEHGMGDSIPATYHHAKTDLTNVNLYDEGNQLNTEAKIWLQGAFELAEKTLKEQEICLLKMADYLSDRRALHKDQIKAMLQKYAHNFDMNSLPKDETQAFYRRHLKEKVAAIHTEEKPLHTPSYTLSLNKTK